MPSSVINARAVFPTIPSGPLYPARRTTRRAAFTNATAALPTGAGTLNFNGITGLSSTHTLSIIDFTTTHPAAMGTDGTDDRFIVNQDLSGVLNYITIDGVTPTPESLRRRVAGMFQSQSVA